MPGLNLKRKKMTYMVSCCSKFIHSGPGQRADLFVKATVLLFLHVTLVVICSN